MGVVDLVRDRSCGELVALKTLTAVEHDNLYRFKREFRSLAGLDHPNLGSLYELIEFGGEWHLVMEYVDGVDLLTHLCNGSPSSLFRDMPTAPLANCQSDVLGSGCRYEDEQALRLAFQQLALGLHGLHEAGWLHRDLKPANVMVTRPGRVVLLDFGMVAERWKPSSRATLDDRAFGTPAYMAPEQAAGDVASVASDWYAFGVMLYEALTGQLPFDGSVLDILVRKQSAQPCPPRELHSDVPEDLDRLCMELLSPVLADRPSGSEIIRRCRPDLGVISRAKSRRRGTWTDCEVKPQRLLEAFRRLSLGRPLVARIEGAAGTGKTALGDQFVDTVRDTGPGIVLAGRCFQGETLPMKGVDSIVDSLARHLKGLRDHEIERLFPRWVSAVCALFPVLRKVPALERARVWEPPGEYTIGDIRDRACDALLYALRSIASRDPLILWIDDLHWGDPKSAELLKRLVDAPAGLRLMLLYSVPPHGAAPFPCGPSQVAHPIDELHVVLPGRNDATAMVSARRVQGQHRNSAGISEGAERAGGRSDELLRIARTGGSTAGLDRGGPAAGSDGTQTETTEHAVPR